MARTCSDNVSGSKVYFTDPVTGDIRTMTRGTVIPPGVDMLLAVPYRTPPLERGLLTRTGSFLPIGVTTIPGALVYTVDTDGRLVHTASGPVTEPDPKYPRVAPDALLGELRSHSPTARQAEVLREVATLRTKLHDLAVKLPPLPTDQLESHRAMFTEYGVDTATPELTELMDTIHNLYQDEAFGLRPAQGEDSYMATELRHLNAPTAIDELYREAWLLAAARVYGISADDARTIADGPRPSMRTAADILERDDYTGDPNVWCVYVETGVLVGDHIEAGGHQLESVWASEALADDRKRALALIHTVDEVEVDFRPPQVTTAPWAPHTEPGRPAVTAPPITYEHACAYVVDLDEIVTEDLGLVLLPSVRRHTMGMYATRAEAEEAAATAGTFADHVRWLDEIRQFEAARVADGEMDPSYVRELAQLDIYRDDASPDLDGTTGALLVDPTGSTRERGRSQWQFAEIADTPRAVVVAMPIDPSLPTLPSPIPASA